MCGECDGHCAKGLPVADVLRYVMYADGYGQFELGRDHFKKLPVELASVRCGDCPTCTVKCRFGVKVPRTPQPRAGDVCVGRFLIPPNHHNAPSALGEDRCQGKALQRGARAAW